MPQISKIRIVNFNYNDGNRFISDELFDLTSPETGNALNTLFNLYNGGGKTVLVQLMMQPVHPKAMAGGRRIEDYFVHSGDHSFILLEWELDDSRDKLLTGIAIAAGTSNKSDESRRGNHIRYYTFKTIYDGDPTPYSIAALELSKNENGKYVPASFEYIREKAKLSRGVLECYSSDESVKWAKMLSEEYGIHRTEWESVIETLNKDEGGLNQYFDDAKTSDKLISKFFIPAIEHKLVNAASRRTDSSLETMLINYAKKIADKENVIKERNTNKQLLGDLSEIYGMVEKLYTVNDEFRSSIADACGFKAALSKRISEIDAEIGNIDREAEKTSELIRHIKYEECSKAYYVGAERLSNARSDFEEIAARLDNCQNTLNDKKHETDILQCARLYKDILNSLAKTEEYKRLIEDKENNSEDAERIASLKYSVFVKAEAMERVQADNAAELEAEIEKADTELKEYDKARKETKTALESAKENYNKAESELSIAKKNTDKRSGSLGIDLIRKFDGFYSSDELNDKKSERTDRLEQLRTNKQKMESAIYQAEIRKNKIPEEKAAIQIKQNSLSDDLKKAEAELENYISIKNKLAMICEKYSLTETAMFSDLLKDSVRKDIDTAKAELTAAQRKKQELIEKKTAAEKGCLHILPEIMRYIESTGIPCQTGEDYLSRLLENGDISNDAAKQLLSFYPEFAYSLLFDTDKDLQKILDAGNITWLPAVVPLFTMEQVLHILDGSMERSTFLSACDSSYFSDREDYVSRIEKDIEDTDAQIARRSEHLKQAESDRDIIECFNYSEDWKAEQDKNITSFKQELASLDENISELDSEKQKLDDDLEKLKKELETAANEISKINSWLESFSELEAMLCDETELYNKQQSTYVLLQNAKSDYKTASDEYETCKSNSDSLNEKLKDINNSLEKTRDILEKVSDAKKAPITDGELDILFSRYNSRLSAMSEDLDRLKNDLESEQEKLHTAKKELNAYSCNEEEYETVIYSSEHLRKVRSECNKLEEEEKALRSDYDSRNRKCGSAEEEYNAAQSALAEYEGIALPKDRIGDDFKARIKAADSEIKALNVNKNILGKENNSLERIMDQVSGLLDELNAEPAGKIIALENDPAAQWKTLNAELKNRKDSYDNMQNELADRLGGTVSKYKDNVLSEIIGKLNSVRLMVRNKEQKGDRLFTAGESIEAMIDSIEKINSKIDTDLREIENNFTDIVEQCFIQGKRMYTDLRTITSSSKAHIYEGKPQIQMVKMDLPDEKEISEEASRVSISNEIEQGANELRDMIKNGHEDKLILKRARSIVGSEHLLHKYIRKESISVKVYKIDLNSTNSSYKKWEDALTQSSGAEKFVVFFSVVLTLMNYTRSSAELINRNTKSVLILDNPFGKITSAHLLKPMFDIAKHFNVQMICLSDINKSDVISCFECVIKLVIKMQSLSNYEIMTHEGNERIEHGYYKIMNGQLSLFG